MNNYFVNPSIIYWIGVISNIDKLLSIMIFCCALLLVICALLCAKNYMDRRDFTKPFSLGKNFLIATTILLIISSLIPTEKVMYRMLISTYFTEENTKNAVDTIYWASEKLNNKIIKERNKMQK